ncbi:Hypothetical predicted protein [Pelobates cultripes]|uniref:Uncharacterized protein n=1 Tax=Pelobates cultripes TaxID=61616 RepID=A0AAD1WW92_PELCU|nr:Hypothetical predicted protein [Pelobates cultripes]
MWHLIIQRDIAYIELYKLQRTLISHEIRKDSDLSSITPFFSKQKTDINITNPAIKTFIQAIKGDITNIVQHSPQHRHNLTKSERTALKDLQKDSQIVIRPVDKGGVVVIQMYQNYKHEILKQLEDRNTYRRLTYDPVSQFQKRIDEHIQMGLQLGVIDFKTAK